MKIYLVGGAVRDQLLNLPVKERDWVVVGATPEEMLAQGYKQVGRDFPVFLHPVTHEEYALARTERKTGKGYTQFECHSDPSVTLEDDLRRRDLTINAMAMTLDGKIIDPYGGQRDLRKRILRHVSEAFVEDPVRILRVARFAAKFSNFKVHSKTMQLMRDMLAAGEVDALVADRVWQEFLRALQGKCPWRFFDVLNRCGVLQKIFPQFARHIGELSRPLKKRVCEIPAESGPTRLAVITYVLAEQEVRDFCNRYNVPNEYKELALLVVRQKKFFSDVLCADPEQILKILETSDALRRPERFKQFLLVCKANEKKHPKTKSDFLLRALSLVQKVDVRKIVDKSLPGEEICKALRLARVEILKNKLQTKRASHSWIAL